MITVVVETDIAATPERCFDLARDLDVHCRTTKWTQERIIHGPAGRLIELGDTVTFQARHFGVRQNLTAKIVAMDRPRRFEDEMVSGAFQSLKHIHEFEPSGNHTKMRDTLILAAPFGLIGRVAERLFLGEYMRRFLQRRNTEMKRIAETE